MRFFIFFRIRKCTRHEKGFVDAKIYFGSSLGLIVGAKSVFVGGWPVHLIRIIPGSKELFSAPARSKNDRCETMPKSQSLRDCVVLIFFGMVLLADRQQGLSICVAMQSMKEFELI